MMFIGACRYCGQVSAEQPEEMRSQDQADDWVTEHCSCTRAAMDRRIKERVLDAQERVRELFGENCREYGFQSVEPQAVEVLEELAALAARDVIRTATVQLRGHGKANISVSAKGAIKVARIEAKACQLEA